jgi:hypothetical protein
VQADEEVLPVEGLYVPWSQEMQADLPVEGLYVPARQEVQDDVSQLSLYFPLGHSQQLISDDDVYRYSHPELHDPHDIP